MMTNAGCRTRRTLALLFLLLTGVLEVYAETSFKIGPKFSWTTADISEYVYINRPYRKLSQLDWDVHNVWQFGVTGELSHDRFVFSADYSRVKDVDCGLMQDYDWLYLYVSNPDYPVTTVTEFSEHPIKLLEKINFNFNTSWKAVKRSNFSLAIGGGIQYLINSIEGHGGYLQHSTYTSRSNTGYTNENVHPYDSNRPKREIDDRNKVISYQQEIESLWITVRADIMPLTWLTFIIEGGLSPWQKIKCLDFHYYTQTTGVLYKDTPLSDVMYKAAFSTILNVSKRSSLGVACSVLSLPYSEGNSYIYGGSRFNRLDTLGGTDYLGWNVSLSYLIRIF